MKINQSKSKTKIINSMNKYQFNTILNVNGDIKQTVKETELLATILTDDLKWDKTQTTL